jgi:autotransporter-associated beta strand protein
VDDFGAVTGDLRTEGVGVSAQSTLIVGGIFKLNGYSKATLGATNSTLIVGGLEMTGALLTQTAGTNLIRLNGDVTTFPSVAVSRLGNSTTATTVTELNGTRAFNVADGPTGLDLSLSTAVQDSTAPVAAGGIIKNGAGVMQIEGSGGINAYTGPTVVNEGTLMLFKSIGTNATGSGAATNTLTIGDGVGGARADKVIIRNSDQIADTTAVTVGSSGLLDLGTFAKSETIGSLSGSGAVDLGPGSVLTNNGAVDAVFSGPITGSGAFIKNGPGNLELSNVNDIAAGTTINDSGRVTISGTLGGNVSVNGTATLAGSGIINGAVNMNSGTTMTPGNAGPGKLTVNGAVSLNSGSAFSLELNGTNPGTGYDQLVVGSTGNILISDSTFAFTLGFAPPFQNFVLIDNQSATPIAGFFNNLPEGQILTATFNNTQYTFTATYVGGDGNDLVLAVPEPAVGLSLAGGIGLLAGIRRRRRSERE